MLKGLLHRRATAHCIQLLTNNVLTVLLTCVLCTIWLCYHTTATGFMAYTYDWC
jgi:hypothetical protein